MASDESADDAAFTDCVASGGESRPNTPAARRRRQLSVPEMGRIAENRKPKRPAFDRGSRSPRDVALPAAKRPAAGPAEASEVGLSAAALSEIRHMHDTSVASIIKAFEAKFEQMERRVSCLESDLMDKDIQIRQLNEQLSQQTQINSSLQAQVESIDLNRRLSSLIFTCEDFGPRAVEDRVEEKIVQLLNNRIQGLRLTSSDIQAAHRLQRDDKIIVKFVKRSVRDAIYDARFSLTSRPFGAGSRAGTAPLYISESLTASNQSLFNQLLQARKDSNGTLVASVFSRRGLVFCRSQRRTQHQSSGRNNTEESHRRRWYYVVYDESWAHTWWCAPWRRRSGLGRGAASRSWPSDGGW